MKNNASSRLLNLILTIGIAMTFLILLATPLITTAFFKSALSILNHNLIFKISFCIYLCSIPYIISLFKLKRLCKLIIQNSPFSIENIKALKSIAINAFSEIFLVFVAFLYLKNSTFFFSNFPIGLPIIIVLTICVPIGLFCLILAQVFHNAMEIKEENDQTI